MSITYNIDAKQNVEQLFESVLSTNFNLLQKLKMSLFSMDNTQLIHDLRVCLRKMRSLFSIFKFSISKDALYFLSNEMHYFGLKLDYPRDLDVYIENYFNKETLSHGEKLVYQVAKKQQDKEHKKVITLLQSKRFERFLKSLENWILEKEWRKTLNLEQNKKLQENCDNFARNTIHFYQKNILSFGVDIEHLSDKSLHKLRILLKKLRYVTEFFSPLLQDNISLLIKNLKKLQDILGFLHDRFILKKLHKKLLKKQRSKEIHEFKYQLELQQKIESIKVKKVLKVEWENFIKIKRHYEDSFAIE